MIEQYFFTNKQKYYSNKIQKFSHLDKALNMPLAETRTGTDQSRHT